MSAITRGGRIRTLALLTGGALLARAARTATRSRSRAAAQGVAGTALLAVGLRRGRGDRIESPVSEAEPAGKDAEKPVSDDAIAARERHDVLPQSDTNPRGISEGLEDEVATDSDDGDVRFTTTGDEPRSKPTLEDGMPGDPRYDDSDGPVEIDLSEAALADEASEATGPDPEQSLPTRTEDTEPDSSPPEDGSHMQADVPDGRDGADESDTTDDYTV